MTEPLRILVAPDKFKGTLTARQAAATIADALRDEVCDTDITELPIADGGEGSIDAVLAAGGRRYTTRVTGPLGRSVTAVWAGIGHWAVIELAAASGLQLIHPDTRTALGAQTVGTGELIRAALDRGYRTIAVCLGGSASTDGGSGLLQALGARFYDRQRQRCLPSGAALQRISTVDVSALDPRLEDCRVFACCDVQTPLLGPRGAAALFGPQKGATPLDVAVLESGLGRFAAAMLAATGRDATTVSWSGAAGGTAGGLYAGVGAEFRSGYETIAMLLEIDKQLAATDLVVVGEGRLDDQSLTGKAPIALARHAAARGIPVLAVAGSVDVDPATLATNGVCVAAGAAAEAPSHQAAMDDPVRWVRAAASRVFRRYRDMQLSVAP